jgi:hypothetical protein
MSYKPGDRVYVPGEGLGSVLDVHSPNGVDVLFDHDGCVQGIHVSSLAPPPKAEDTVILDWLEANGSWASTIGTDLKTFWLDLSVPDNRASLRDLLRARMASV